MLVVHILAAVFIFIGCLFVFGGALGLIRMPDLYTRLHAASLTDTGGAIFIVMGLLLMAIFEFSNSMAAIKLLLVLAFIAFTGPTAAHAIAKMALLQKQIPECQNGQSVIHHSLRDEEILKPHD